MIARANVILAIVVALVLICEAAVIIRDEIEIRVLRAEVDRAKAFHAATLEAIKAQDRANILAAMTLGQIRQAKAIREAYTQTRRTVE